LATCSKGISLALTLHAGPYKSRSCDMHATTAAASTGVRGCMGVAYTHCSAC
jgi:hypothetical protein